MAWANIHENDYGFDGKLRIVKDGTAQDISSYTTRQYILKSPAGTIATKTAAFDTDGTDGILSYTFADGDIDRTGTWTVQARIAKTGVELTAKALRFNVEDRIDE